jgi:hypothetical protein
MKLSDFIIDSFGRTDSPLLSEGMSAALDEVAEALVALSPDQKLADKDSLGNKITLNLAELLKSQSFREAVDNSIQPPQPEEDEDAFVARAMGELERIFKKLL